VLSGGLILTSIGGYPAEVGISNHGAGHGQATYFPQFCAVQIALFTTRKYVLELIRTVCEQSLCERESLQLE
jgi:hypothetical protein